MEIKVLGMGCANCKKLEEHVKLAVKELGLAAEVKKVEDMPTIMNYGVLRVPALVIDEKVRSFGKVLSVNEVKALIQAQQ